MRLTSKIAPKNQSRLREKLFSKSRFLDNTCTTQSSAPSRATFQAWLGAIWSSPHSSWYYAYASHDHCQSALEPGTELLCSPWALHCGWPGVLPTEQSPWNTYVRVPSNDFTPRTLRQINIKLGVPPLRRYDLVQNYSNILFWMWSVIQDGPLGVLEPYFENHRTPLIIAYTIYGAVSFFGCIPRPLKALF